MSSTFANFVVGAQDDDALPACASCRKRKLKCSREHPSCSQCQRLAVHCVYSPKQKPGLKTGAVEALTKRIAFLEQIILDAQGNPRQQFDTGGRIGSARHNSSIQSEDNRDSTLQDRYDRETSTIADPTPSTGSAFETGHDVGTPRNDIENQNGARKRKRLQPNLPSLTFDLDTINFAEHLPPLPLLLKLVNYFCVSFHHWIPYLHKQRLRNSVCSNPRPKDLDLVLHALTAATLRRIDRNTVFLDEDQVDHQVRTSRFIVETFAVKDVSLQSLRALIIIVFDYLNDGQSKRAYPLIASLSRTVDYLQLTLEPSASQFGALMNPVLLVEPTTDWTELEERRRVFFVIFLLDRFCSVSTGWNTSLTSEDVHRRLPADGGYFTKQEPVTTPYFGVWSKSAAKIGKSIAHFPAQYNEEDAIVEHVQEASPSSVNGMIDASKLGAFAYCIEASELLSQVTTFFLQQRINWQEKEHAVNWLTRFKELDLRLVHWKLFLPPRWKDSNISSDTEVVDMDPNLTLAHITHNTSLILLHHSIAYPPKGWNNYVALPKECSVQTCEHAAVSTAYIVEKFLTHTRIDFVNVQFAFCTFVAAKALLYVHQATKKALLPEFQRLTQNLWEMSARWTGSTKDNTANSSSCNRSEEASVDQAGLYALQLEYLYECGQHDPRYQFNLYDHSCRKVDSTASTSPAQSTTLNHIPGALIRNRRSSARHSRTMSYPPPIQQGVHTTPPTALYGNAIQSPIPYLPPSAQSPGGGHLEPQSAPAHILSHPQNTYPMTNTSPQTFGGNNGTLQQHPQDQSLLNLSDAFNDTQFLGLDRVITFEDANFYMPGDQFRWQ
ncbi:hypothetical protein P154DRAFT_592344 [Amniculicola lignicola CBS 123094]|uniref:Zn(2)-C6 fungal-type domain-containing protein n=1 Tax=Amniculicola lignicola CBS 123094 TaxID=1392246 RepID=A0A6A5WZM8_9PLEO|nr:hypothetical protein P154DRAFT_592344 [Amniculicola lignicola CBS 123094]